MIALLRAVPVWAWLVAAIIALLAGALTYQTAELNIAEAMHARYVAEVERAASEAQQKARTEEQRRQEEINRVRTDAQEQIKAAGNDAAVAASAADSLQREVDKLLASRSTCDTRVAQGSKTVDRLTDLLADLRRRADERAGELARIADENRIAGQACERAYDSLTVPPRIFPGE